jgi:hypothetical protein
MFAERDDIKKINRPPKAGRVIDLRKTLESVDNQVDAREAQTAPVSLKGFVKIPFLKKNKDINFLKPYLMREKEQEFIEQEMMREFLDETEEEQHRNSLLSFSRSIMGAAKTWRLPLFVLAVLWRLFGRAKARSSVTAGADKSSKEDVLVLRIKKERKHSALGDLFGFFFSWPKSVFRFISGRTTEDYLYQRALIDEMARTRFNPFKHLLPFMAIVLIVMLPIKALSYYKIVDINDLKGRVLGVSEEAVGNIGSAADRASSMDFLGAADDLSSAKRNFTEAKLEMDKVNSLLIELGKLAPSKKIRLASYGKDILSAGEAASSLGENILLAANVFSDVKNKDLPELIDQFLLYENAALSDAKTLSSIMAKIDPAVLPDDRRGQFNDLKTSVNDLVMMLSSASDIAEKAKVFMGSESDKRYLLVFQNNSEMRASGGFIGSFALVDISRGKIKNIEVPGGGSYDTEGGLKKFIVSPEPLWLVNPLWHFWDANWWPDWKKSADKLEWFYAKSGGPSVDGVIAFTPTVLERILSVIGPVDMTEKYGVVMDSDGLWENLRDIIEKEKVEDLNLPQDIAENKPKRVIGDLLTKIAEEIPKRLNKENLPQLIAAFSGSLDDKQILFNFNDKELQAEAEQRNWAGRIKDTNKDYLYVVNTNIAGGKSDGRMKEEISHKAEIADDGSIIDTLVIKKTHTGVDGESYFGVRNVNWLRVYVPLGSKLLLAEGFRGPDPIYFDYPEEDWEQDIDVAAEDGDNAVIDAKNLNTKIYQESGKSVFANWVMVDPGQEVVITLKYKLPFKLEKRELNTKPKSGLEALLEKFTKVEKKDLYVYSLMVQKQPGMRFSSIDSSLKFSSTFNTAWRYPAELPASGGWEISTDLDSDKYWAVLLEKSEQNKNQNISSYGQ